MATPEDMETLGTPMDDADMPAIGDELAPPVEPELPAEPQADVDNLMTAYDAATLDRLGAQIVDQAEADYASVKDWREKTAENLKYYDGDFPESVPDQPNLPVMHLPYAKRAVRIFHTKAVSAIDPKGDDLVEFAVRSPALQEAAELCAIHMNGELRNRIEEFVPARIRGFKTVLQHGVGFDTFYWDELLRRPCYEFLTYEDLWISYVARTDRPDMSDVPRKTWRKPRRLHELLAMEDGGYYSRITQPLLLQNGDMAPPVYLDPELYNEDGTPKDKDGQPDGAAGSSGLSHRPVQQEGDAMAGVERPLTDNDREYEILEQDCMLVLPGEQRATLVKACGERDSKKIVSLRRLEIPDYPDMRRWQEDKGRVDMVNEALRGEWRAAAGQTAAEYGVPPEQMAAEAPQLFPPEPQLQPDPQPPGSVPWHRYVKYDCDVNTRGSLGTGLLNDVKGFNKLADRVATRAVGLETMHLLPTTFHPRGSKLARGEFRLRLGESHEVDMSPEQLKQGLPFATMIFPQADPNAWRFVEISDKSCQEVTAFDVVQGASGKSGETATENENRMSSATDNIAYVMGNWFRSSGYSIKNLARIYAEKLPEEGVVVYRPAKQTDPMTGEETDVMDPVRVTREHYQAILGEMEVKFTTDPAMEGKSVKERRAAKVMQTALQISQTTAGPGGPPVLDPMTMTMLLRGAAVNMMRAAGMDREFIDQIKRAPMPNMAAPMMPGPGGGGPPGEGGPPPGEEGPPGQTGPQPGALPPGEGEANA